MLWSNSRVTITSFCVFMEDATVDSCCCCEVDFMEVCVASFRNADPESIERIHRIR